MTGPAKEWYVVASNSNPDPAPRIVEGRRAAWDTFRALAGPLRESAQSIARKHLEAPEVWAVSPVTGTSKIAEQSGYGLYIATVGTITDVGR